MLDHRRRDASLRISNMPYIHTIRFQEGVIVSGIACDGGCAHLHLEGEPDGD
jgi:hypothetical protein